MEAHLQDVVEQDADGSVKAIVLNGWDECICPWKGEQHQFIAMGGNSIRNLEITNTCMQKHILQTKRIME